MNEKDAALDLVLEGDLVDRLEQLAAHHPDRLLYVELLDGVNETGRLTAREFHERVVAVHAGLRGQGVKSGDVALLIATAPLEFLVGLFACMRAGVIAAPISFPRRPEHIETRLEPVRLNAGAVAVVAGTPLGDAETNVLELLTQERTVVSTSQPAPADAPAPAAERDVAYLQYTSGSTSEPKGVIVTHDNLVDNMTQMGPSLGFYSAARVVSWCPLTHDMGLIAGALPGVFYGCRCVLMPPASFIRKPYNWLAAITKYRGTHTYAPNFGYELCVERIEEDQRAGLDLSTMELFANGAEPVRASTRDRFLEAYAPHGLRPEAWSPAYGLAEATVLVACTPPGNPGLDVRVDVTALERHEVVIRDDEDDEDGTRILCCDGIPAAGYDIRIVDPATSEELPDGTVGELWLRGPSVTRGYWRRPEATEEWFGARLAGDDGGPYLRTGDLAFLHKDHIVICGRAKDLIVVNGRNVHPQDVEFAAEQAHPGVRSGGTAAFAIEGKGTEAIVVLAEVDDFDLAKEVSAAIRKMVLQEFDLYVADVHIVGPRGVPKTSSGKVQRTAARQIWLDAKDAATTT